MISTNSLFVCPNLRWKVLRKDVTQKGGAGDGGRGGREPAVLPTRGASVSRGPGRVVDTQGTEGATDLRRVETCETQKRGKLRKRRQETTVVRARARDVPQGGPHTGRGRALDDGAKPTDLLPKTEQDSPGCLQDVSLCAYVVC